jgi:PAS domain S-box-containing protein
MMTKHAIPSTWSRFAHAWLHDWGTSLTLGCGLYVLLYVLWSFFQWGGAQYKPLIADLGAQPINLAAAVLAWRTATHPLLDHQTRRAWRLLALAYLLYWLGDALWFVYEIILDTHPFPSWADVGYLSFYPLLLWGLLAFPIAPHTRAERLKFWLDTGTVLLAGGMAVWYFVLRPTAMTAHSSPLATTLALAYPAGDLVVLFGVTAIELRRPPASSRHALSLLVAGVLLFFVADLAYGHLSLQGTYQSGDWSDTLWIVALFVMLLSAQVQHLEASHMIGEAAPTTGRIRPYSLLPYGAIGIGYALLLVMEWVDWSDPSGQILLGVVALTTLVIVRQVAAVRENVRLLAERAAYQSDIRFRSLVQHASDIIAVLAADGVIRYTSPSVERVLGYAPADLAGSNGFALVHPDDLPRAQTVLTEALHTPGVHPPVELRLRHRNGDWRHIEVIGNNLLADPSVGEVVINARDMTERKQAEAALAEEHARFGWVVAQADDGYLVLDDRDGILYANSQARHYLNLPAADVVPLHPEDTRQRFEAFRTLSCRQYNCQPEAAWADWPARPAHASQTPRYLVCPASQEAPAFWLQVDLLATTSGAREQYLVRLRDVTATLGERGTMWKFHALVNHKLRAPLSGLTGFLQVIDEHFWRLSDTEKKDFFGVVRQSAGQLQDRIESIFQYLEAPTLARSQRERYTLAGLVALTADISQQLDLAPPTVRYDRIEDPSAIWLALSRQALELIVWELLDNAKKFHPQHTPAVEIKVSTTADALRIDFGDDGVTLAPDQLTKLALPYYQLERYFTGEVAGMGLGLTMVTALLWEVGGRCRITNRQTGAGIVAELIIPLAEQAASVAPAPAYPYPST